jgi:predicted metal-dependent HD superfamily phosphohydrolase
VNDLEERWLRLSDRVSGDKNIARQQLRALVAAYTGRDRYFHNLAHISTCLQLLDGVQRQLVNPNIVEIAIWFHDVVYVPDFAFNEQLSCAVAESFILELTGNCHLATASSHLIMVTKHDGKAPINDTDAQYLVDIDLAILGFNAEAFRQYELAIRNEFYYLQPDEYRQSRVNVLSGLLSQPYIYNTFDFRSEYETTASANITQLITNFNRRSE